MNKFNTSIVLLCVCVFFSGCLPEQKTQTEMTPNGVRVLSNSEVQFRKNERLIRAKIARQPRNEGLAIELAALFGNRGNYEKAAAVLDSAMLRMPKSAKLLEAQSVWYQRDMKYEDAAASLHSGLLLKKKRTVKEVYHLATLYEKAQQWQKAEKTIRDLIKVFPSNADALALLGRVLTAQGRADEALVVLGNTNQRRKSEDLRVATALAYFAEKKWADAEKEARLVIKKAPNCEDAYKILVDSLIELSLFSKAETEAKRWLYMKRSSLPAKRALATAYSKQGKNVDALKLRERIVESSLSTTADDIALASVVVKTGNISRACELYESYLQKSPNDENLLRGYAIALELRNEISSAVEVVEGLVKLNPHDIDLLLFLGRLYAKASLHKDSIDILTLARMLGAKDEASLILLCRGLFELEEYTGIISVVADSTLPNKIMIEPEIYVIRAMDLLERNEEANDKLKELIMEYPSNIKVLELAARRAEGNDAVAFWDNLLKKDSSNNEAMRGKALALQSLGRVDEAFELWKILSKSLTSDVSVFRALSKVAILKDDFSTALNASRTVTMLSPESADDWSVLGECATRSNRYDEATRAFETAVSRKPLDVKLHIELARALMRQEKWALSLEAWESVVSMRLNVAEDYASMSYVLRQLKRGRAALKAMSIAYSCDTANADYLKDMAFILAEDMNDKVNALKLLKKYLQMMPNDEEAKQYVNRLAQ